jgi:hypothetical protein
MTAVRVLVGTRKGAFILTSDGRRETWNVNGPHFPGWEIYHVKGSPVDPQRLYASQSSSWFGQVVHRSDDGGASWSPVGNRFGYEGEAGSHLYYDGTPRPFEFKRVWHFEPSLTDADTVYAGVEDASMFRSTDGGQEWEELPSLRQHRTAPSWAPGAPGSRSTRDCTPRGFPTRLPRSATASTGWRSTPHGRTPCSCRSTGTSCAPTMPARPGVR